VTIGETSNEGLQPAWQRPVGEGVGPGQAAMSLRRFFTGHAADIDDAEFGQMSERLLPAILASPYRSMQK
jgi:hypothetical protein